MTSTPCPNREQLQGVLLGLLPDAESEQIENHLFECQRCVDTMAELGAGDTLVEAMRSTPSVVLELAGYDEQVQAIIRHWQAPRHVELDATPAVSSAEEPTSDLSPRGKSSDDEQESRAFLAPAQAPDEIGRLGPYRVLKVLGSGGMGIVFEAEDLQLKRRVALKAMKPGVAAGASSRKRFLREAQVAASVEHDHIVPIYQVGEDRGVPFIAMPLLRGETLAERLAKRSESTAEAPLPVAEVVRIGREAATGLDAAHRAGLIHRDIKPGNIWLEAGTGRVKILDFGLARAAAADEHLTHTGALVGTPSYMAPEQGRNQEIDARADLFSLGCVLYHMAAGTRPFVGHDALSTLLAVTTHDPRRPSQLNPGLPAELDELIISLLSKNPSDRPQTAREVAERLASAFPHPTQESQSEGELTKSAVRDEASPSLVASLNRPKGDRPRIPPRWRRPVVIAAAAAAALFAGVIIIIKNEKGQVVATIETDKSATVKGAPGITMEVRPSDEVEPSAQNSGIATKASEAAAVNPKSKIYPLRPESLATIRSGVPATSATPNSAQSAIDADPNFALFNWVIKIGGTQSFRVNRELRAVTAPTEIRDLLPDTPQGDDDVWSIDLTDCQNLEDADFERFRTVTKPLRLVMHRTIVTDTALARLNNLPTLVVLRLEDKRISRAGIAALGRLPNLLELWLAGTSTSATDLDLLTNFPKLKMIALGPSHLTKQGAEILSSFPNLTHLYLGKGVGKAELERLVTCRQLIGLYYTDMGAAQTFDDLCVAPLKRLPNLDRLSIGFSAVTDAGIASLPDAVPNLSDLDLNGSRITDAGLKHLHGLKSLTHIQIHRTRTTAAGVAELQAALPNCKIDWTPASPAPTGDTDRDAAEWVLAVGGTVSVQHPDGSVAWAADAQNLPPPPWKLYKVDLKGGTFRDEDLHRLASLSALGRIEISDAKISGAAMEYLRKFSFIHTVRTPVGDAGIAALEDPPNLVDLWLDVADVTDKGLERIGQMRRLRTLYLFGNKGITDAGLIHLRRLSGLRELHLGGTQVTDGGVASLVQLKQLRDLDLNYTVVTDRAFDSVAELPQLQRLGVQETRITDSGLAALGKLEKLKSLYAPYNAITDIGMSEISRLTELEYLDVGATRITDEGLAAIRSLKKLKTLILGRNAINDAGMSDLAKLTSLEILNLSNTGVGDDGVEKLAALTKLQDLRLDGVELTDDGLRRLRALTNLKQVYVQNTQVTAAGVAELQAALPNCKIVWNGKTQ